MKILLTRCSGGPTAGTVVGGCLVCGADLEFARTAPLDVEVPVVCGDCGFEIAIRRLEGDRAAVRYPYGCRRFAPVDSSNLEAVGLLDRDLVVRFRSGGAYRYAGAGALFDEVLAAESKGRFFHARVRERFPTTRLCARYGCAEAARGRGSVYCAAHSDTHRS